MPDAPVIPVEPTTKARRRILVAIDLTVHPERCAGIADYAREKGWILDCRLLAFIVRGQHQQYLAATPIDGILSLVNESSNELFDTVSRAGVPVVDLWHDRKTWAVPRVLLDHHGIGWMGAQHLLHGGFRNVMFYSHTVDSRIATLRRDGFNAFAKEHGLHCDELWWDTDTPMPPGDSRIAWLGRHLKGLPRPVGVLAVNDFVASEVIDAAEQAGLRVPDDVAVLGADNNPILTELGAVPLSSIDVAKRRVGYEAAALLDRMMNGEPVRPDTTRVPPVGVVVRRSTEVIAVLDAEIGRAARYIQQHFREPITVADVAAAAFLSRRRLQDRFRAALGHGMNEEIVRQRLQFSKQLLTQTSHKISSIAVMAGFGSVQRMSKVFRRDVAITPRDYRQKFQTKAMR